MTPSEKARVRECVRELSEILYRNTPSDKCQSLEDIEKAVREHLLKSVGPEMAFFLSNNKLKPILEKKERVIKSSVGKLRLRRQQLIKLGVEARIRISPLLEKCCLCLSAMPMSLFLKPNETYFYSQA